MNRTANSSKLSFQTLSLALSYILTVTLLSPFVVRRVNASNRSASKPQSINKQLEMRANELLIRFSRRKYAMHPQQMEAIFASKGIKRIAALRGSSRIERYEITNGQDPQALALELKSIPGIEMAEPNYLIKKSSLPNDPEFNKQWGLWNQGQTGGQVGIDIGATLAWETTTGDPSTIIAVVDSGIEFTHPDLRANQWINKVEKANKADDNKDGYIDDLNGWDFVKESNQSIDEDGHGTGVAGVIAAEGNNGVGLSGVMWRASLMNLRVLDGQGVGDIGKAVEAIDYAVANGAKIINLSWGTEAESLALGDAIARAGRRKVAVIAAAGNGSRDIDADPYYPASYRISNLVSVSAIDASGKLASFSNYGAGSVTIGAPGVEILTTGKNSSYTPVSGTSIAAAHIAGVAGLIKTLRPNIAAEDVRTALISGAKQLAELSGKVSTSGMANISGLLEVLNSIPSGHGDKETNQANRGSNSNNTGLNKGKDVIKSSAFNGNQPVVKVPIPKSGKPGTSLPDLNNVRRLNNISPRTPNSFKLTQTSNSRISNNYLPNYSYPVVNKESSELLLATNNSTQYQSDLLSSLKSHNFIGERLLYGLYDSDTALNINNLSNNHLNLYAQLFSGKSLGKEGLENPNRNIGITQEIVPAISIASMAQPLQSTTSSSSIVSVSIQSINGQYLSLDSNAIRASKSSIGNLEKFNIVDLNGGVLESGDTVYVQADNGQYLTAQDGGGNLLTASSTEAGSWQTFKIVKVGGSGVIRSGNHFVIQTSNSRYWYTESGEPGLVNASGQWMNGNYETFIITLHSPQITKSQPVIISNKDNRLELFFRGSSNTLYHKWQTVAGENTWSEWQSLNGSLPSDVVTVKNADGRIEIFSRGFNGELYHKWQTSPGSSTWSDWKSEGGNLPSDPVVVSNADGRLEVFIRGLNGELWHKWQTAPNSTTWSEWKGEGGYQTSDPIVASNADGRLEVFIIGRDRSVYHKWQTAPNSTTWSEWKSEGGSLQLDPVVVKNADGRLELFLKGWNGSLYHKWQTSPGSSTWSDWKDEGGSWPSNPVIVSNADGRLEIFARGQNGSPFHKWQLSANSTTWSEWKDEGGFIEFDPVVALNSDGRLEIFIVGGTKEIYRKWQISAGSSNWSSWTSEGGNCSFQPIVVKAPNGRLELFIRGNDGGVHHKWQTTIGSTTWTVWKSQGNNFPPSTWITNPINNGRYDGSTLLIEANTVGNDDTITKVEFYQGTTKIGEDVSAPYSYEWKDINPGDYVLTTKAYSSNGTVGKSLPVSIKNIQTSQSQRLHPNNRRGSSGVDPLSGNYNWGINLLSLPGRGLNTGIGLSYNSRVWTRIGSQIYYNLEDDRPSPGFRLGYPVVELGHFNDVAGKYAYLMILPSGEHIELLQTNTVGIYESTDSSYIQLKDRGNGSLVVTTTDGTQYSYLLYGNKFQCIEIKDRNGNYITNEYKYGNLKKIKDTLNREIFFNYNSDQTLDTITQKRGTEQYRWASFSYTSVTINTKFTGLTLVGPQNGTSLKLLSHVGLNDGSYFYFEYTSYGQVRSIVHYAADSVETDASGNSIYKNSHALNYINYNLPTSSSNAQTDCPRFTEERVGAESWTEVLTTYKVDSNQLWSMPDGSINTGAKVEITTPDNIVHKSYYKSAGWIRGLPVLSETWVANSKKKYQTTAWTQDNTNVSYQLNPRVTEVNTYDAEGNRKRISTTYTNFGLPSDVIEYATDATTVYRKTHTDYITDSRYIDRRIIGLPGMVQLFDGNGNVHSKTEYHYDYWDDFLQNQGAATQHDGTNYGTNLNVGRGNLCYVRRWDVTAPNDVSKAIAVNQIGYNTTGQPIFAMDGIGSRTNISYADNFSDGVNRNTYVYPTTVTDPDGYSTTTKYNYHTGQVAWAQNPKGATVTNEYDSAGRILKSSSNNGGYTRLVYPASQTYVQSYSLIDTGVESYAISVFDGAGRVRAKATLHPGSVGGYSGQYFKYDKMGNLTDTSNPAEIDGEWNPRGDDANGWVYSYQAYDWQGKPTVHTNQDGTQSRVDYEGCGCAGGTKVTTTDEVGRKERSYLDSFGRVIKTERLNWDGSVYGTVTTSYNILDQVTNINDNGQHTTYTYDGHARVATNKLPIQSNPSSYTYYDNDSLKTSTDARGAVATYTYNNRNMVTGINFSAPSHITAASPISFDYDEVGNRKWMVDGSGRTDYNFDTFNLLRSETRKIGLLDKSYTINYEYNLSRKLKKITDPFGASISYNYEQTNKLYSATGEGLGTNGTFNIISHIKYRAWGDIKEIANDGRMLQKHSFNNRMQITAHDIDWKLNIFNYFDPNTHSRVYPVTHHTTSYEYDADGRINHIVGGYWSYTAAQWDLEVDNSFGTQTGYKILDRKFRYDQVGRLTDAYTNNNTYNDVMTAGYNDIPCHTGAGQYILKKGFIVPYTNKYNYDVWGHTVNIKGTIKNQLSFEHNTTFVNDRDQSDTYDEEGNAVLWNNNRAYDAANRLAQEGTINKQYDGDGVLITSYIQNYNSVAGYFSIPSTVLGGEKIIVARTDGTLVKRKHLVGPATVEYEVEPYQDDFTSRIDTYLRVIFRRPVTGDLIEDKRLIATTGYISTDRAGIFQDNATEVVVDALGNDIESLRTDFCSMPTSLIDEEPEDDDGMDLNDGGDASNLKGGCYLDGMETPCNLVTELLNSGISYENPCGPSGVCSGTYANGRRGLAIFGMDPNTGETGFLVSPKMRKWTVSPQYPDGMPNSLLFSRYSTGNYPLIASSGGGFSLSNGPANSPEPQPVQTPSTDPCAGKKGNLDHHRSSKTGIAHITPRHIEQTPRFQGKSRYTFPIYQNTLTDKQTEVMNFNQVTFMKGTAYPSFGGRTAYVYAFPDHDWTVQGLTGPIGARWFQDIGIDASNGGQITNVNTVIVGPDCAEVITSHPGLPRGVSSTDPMGGGTPYWRAPGTGFTWRR
jgi:hypothetical protein